MAITAAGDLSATVADPAAAVANGAAAPHRKAPAVARAARVWADWRWTVPLAAGFAALALTTFEGIAKVSWSTEQGAHGPVVLALGLWLLINHWPAMAAHADPGSPRIGAALLVPAMLLYIAARIAGSIVIESMALYLILIATLYLFIGWRAMRVGWFPLAFLLFVLPPPGSFVALATQPLRLQLSEAAVWLLSKLDYPVARSGLNIVVDQYRLEVKAACGGLNSMISLTAMGLFYAYLRHRTSLAYNAVFFVAIVAMAILANLVRVALLILITYYFGHAAAEGFLHQFAGLTMFAVAMGGVLLFDEIASRVWRGRSSARAV